LLDRVLITVGGSLADLDRLDGSTLLADLDVAGLEVGTGSAPVSIDLPAGVALVAASPDSVSVTVTSLAPASPAALVSPSPAADGSAPPPSPSPGG
jgi:hypothetical protein